MSGNYIVVFKDHVPQSEIDKYANEVNQNGGNVGQRYDNVLKGFSATIPESYLQRLQSFQDSIIDYIEPDSIVTTQGKQ
ncbi:protease propeptide/inhibitor [Trametes cingulata]|nr:protease propeptide/inhibitor [Trametes cingulata]